MWLFLEIIFWYAFIKTVAKSNEYVRAKSNVAVVSI